MVFSFGSNSNGRRTQAGQQPPQQPGLNYAASQSNVNLQPIYGGPFAAYPPPQNFQLLFRPPPGAFPPPANAGWPAPFPGPYPPPQPASKPARGLNIKWASTTNLTATPNNMMWKSSVSLPAAVPGNAAAASMTNLNGSGYIPQNVGLCDLVSSKFDSVISCIDEELFSGEENDLIVYTLPTIYDSSIPTTDQRALGPNRATVPSESSSNHFQKVWLYANSRLPPYLPPMKLYMSTYPLICLAAQYSERVYVKPTGGERENHVSADFRRGTKAMVLKSLPIDDMNTIVFAIRGSQSIMDWCVNYRTAPASPEGFLDDPGNCCHSGFLGVAKKTAALVAERLRTLLQENPARSTASLLICGHSAGGAVAQLLYSHMMSQSSEVNSDLKYLTGFFRRVHCVTFGAPPVSLLPLQQPGGNRNRKSLFFAFVNEGDPVVRADKAVVASLLKLYASPVPSIKGVDQNTERLADGKSCAALTAAAVGVKSKGKMAPKVKPPKTVMPTGPLPVWNVPPGTLSLGGRLVLLRDRPGAKTSEDVGAFGVMDEQMRSVVFGDPVKHMMKLYARRVEFLATKAATAQGFG